METVEVVIKIPKGYKKLVDDMFGNNGLLPSVISEELFGAISLGTVLPKGHGKLIDGDAVTKDINTFQDAFIMYTDNMGKYNIGCTAPTIIEADKETEVDDEPCSKCKHSDIEDAQSGYCDSCYAGEYFKPKGDRG